MTVERKPPLRRCSLGCEGVRTTLYIQHMSGVLPSYAVLCRDHAKSRRAFGYRLSPVRKSKGTY